MIHILNSFFVDFIASYSYFINNRINNFFNGKFPNLNEVFKLLHAQNKWNILFKKSKQHHHQIKEKKILKIKMKHAK